MNQISIGSLRAASGACQPNQRAVAKARTREKILAAAAALFSEHGYEGATIRDIAKGAGMSTGAVFASFADKSDLFGEIVAAEQGALEAAMIAASEARGTGSAVLAMLDAAADRQMADLPLFQATMSAIWTPGLGPTLRRRLRRRPTTALIGEAIKTDLGDRAESLDAAFLAEVLWDAYVSVVRRAALDGWAAADVKTRLRREVDLVLAGALHLAPQK